jgi:hypothetical protein
LKKSVTSMTTVPLLLSALLPYARTSKAAAIGFILEFLTARAIGWLESDATFTMVKYIQENRVRRAFFPADRLLADLFAPIITARRRPVIARTHQDIPAENRIRDLEIPLVFYFVNRE